MSLYGAGESYHYGFSTYDSSNALADADGPPSGTLVVNGSDSGATVTIGHPAIGRYSISASLAGRSVGDDCFVRYSATVGGVTQEARTPPFRVAFPAALSGGVLTAGSGTAQLAVSSGNARVQGAFKLNTAAGFEFAMVQSTDHVTAYTGGSVTATREINGAGTTAAAGAVAQVGTTNRYYFGGTAADFNGANVTFTFAATGADPVTVSINTTP